MSLKAVELQIALPRTQEAGRQQEQIQHKLINEQQDQMKERKELDELNRTRTQDINKTEQGQIREKQEKEHAKKDRTQAKKAKAQKQLSSEVALPASKDPMRGRVIDISL